MTERFRQHERVEETTTTTGTGTATLAGATSKARTFASAMTVGQWCAYAIEHTTANEWEVGFGVLDTTTTLIRERTIASSNAGSLVSLSAGTKKVWITSVADHSPDLEAFGASTNDVTISGSTTLAADTWYGDLILQHTLNPAGYFICVSGVLDMTSASALITRPGTDGTTGTAGVNTGTGQAGGASGASITDVTWGGSRRGGTGGRGGDSPANAGLAAGQSGLGTNCCTGPGGNGGNNTGWGGSAGGGGGAVPNSHRPIVSTRPNDYHEAFEADGTVLIAAGTGGGGGGGGGTQNSRGGAGGGGGGSGAPHLTVFAAALGTGGSTAAGCIRANGGSGGHGGAHGFSGAGGSGGGGGAGGLVTVIVGRRIGAVPVTGLIQSVGGNGGNAGVGTFNGTVGDGGYGGIVFAVDLQSGTVTKAGNTANSGQTGGTTSVTF